MNSPYDSSYVPPAPSIDIWLSGPGETFSVGPLRALVDTGADACVVPFAHLAPLRLPLASQRYLRGYAGDRRTVDVYLLDVGIGRLRLPGIETLADELGDEMIVGRNVLNKLTMILDGPRQTLEVRE